MATLDLARTPALPPPPGVIPDFSGPAQGVTTLLFTQLFCLVIATLFLWMRMYTKSCVMRCHAWEDSAMAIAWAIFIPLQAIALAQPRYGRIHQWNMNLIQAEPFAHTANTLEVLYSPSLFFAKLSILLQLVRIFSPQKTGRFHRIAWLLIWLNAAIYLATTLIQIWHCVPRRKIWNPTVKGHCIDSSADYIVTAAINCLSDFLVLILPLAKIWHLNMAPRTKIGVSAVFTAAGFAVICSCMRLSASLKTWHSPDTSWTRIPMYEWAVAEIAAGIVCGCMPVLPQFIRHFKTRMVSYYTSIRRPSGDEEIGCCVALPQERIPNSKSFRGSSGSSRGFRLLSRVRKFLSQLPTNNKFYSSAMSKFHIEWPHNLSSTVVEPGDLDIPRSNNDYWEEKGSAQSQVVPVIFRPWVTDPMMKPLPPLPPLLNSGKHVRCTKCDQSVWLPGPP